MTEKQGFAISINKSISKGLILIFILCFGFVFSQIDTKIDKDHIKIGEPIQYTLTVKINPGDRVILPEVSDMLSSYIEVLDHKTDTLNEGSQIKLIREMTLTGFDAGDYLIRSLPIVINSDTILSHSFQVKIDDVELEEGDLTGFPIKSIMDEKFTWKDYWDRYGIYALGALLLIFAILAIRRFLKNKKEEREFEEVIIKTPYDEAKDALVALDEKRYLEKGEYSRYYAELSYLLRKYFGRIFNFSSLELLSDDLIGHLKKSSKLTIKETEEFKEFLFDSDLAKFAKSVPEAHKHSEYRSWVEKMIDKYKPVPVEENEEDNLNKPKNG